MRRLKYDLKSMPTNQSMPERDALGQAIKETAKHVEALNERKRIADRLRALECPQCATWWLPEDMQDGYCWACYALEHGEPHPRPIDPL